MRHRHGKRQMPAAGTRTDGFTSGGRVADGPEPAPDPRNADAMRAFALGYRRYGVLARYAALLGIAAAELGICSVADAAVGKNAGTFVMALSMPVVLVCVRLAWRAVIAHQAAAVRRMARHHGHEIAGPLLDVLAAEMRYGGRRWTAMMAECVDRLVPVLREVRISDTSILVERQRQTMYAVLWRCARYHRPRFMYDSPYDVPPHLCSPRFVKAILSALEHVGDARAVPVVARLAEAAGDLPDDRGIRDAARDCLGALTRTAERTRLSTTLLRPAAPAGDEMLLRPAHGVPTGDPELLLRPAEKVEEEQHVKPTEDG